MEPPALTEATDPFCRIHFSASGQAVMAAEMVKKLASSLGSPCADIAHAQTITRSYVPGRDNLG